MQQQNTMTQRNTTKHDKKAQQHTMKQNKTQLQLQQNNTTTQQNLMKKRHIITQQNPIRHDTTKLNNNKIKHNKM